MSLVFVMITTLVCAVGCKKAEAHKHTWATEWSVGGETHWHACTVEGCTAKKDEADHTGTAATCTAKAVCTVCNAEYGEKDPDNHDLEEHAAKAPTCTEIGWDAYVTCKRGGCTYTTYQEKTALDHDWDTEWTTSETQHWHKCKRTGCNAKNAESDHTVGVLRQPVRQRRFALRVTSSTAKRMPKIIPKRLTDTKRTATARTRKFILVAARQKTLPKIVR